MTLYTGKGDFDPRTTAVVRVDATRLRAKLREYYSSDGAADAIVIDLPKGSYTPTFREGANRQALIDRAESRIPEPSIVVLPFSNLSPDPEAYFSDGLSEEIIHALSGIPGIRVVARTSAFALKHRNADIREIGRLLNVNFVLEGSVRKSGEDLRVTVQLASTADGYQLWSRRYERKVKDVFAVQEEIALAITDMLRGDKPRELKHISFKSKGDFESYEWYLRGRHHLNRQTREEFHRAIECFEEACSRNPAYSLALSGMAVAWFYLAMFSMDAPLEAMPKAQRAATRALEMNESDGDALSVLACSKAMFDWNWNEAELLFKRAFDAQSRSDLPEHLFALLVLLPLVRIEEALSILDAARRIDPLSLFVAATRGAVLLMARRTEEAEHEYRRALELDSNFWRALVGLGRCHEARGDYENAIECFERATSVSDSVPTAIGALGRAYAIAGKRKEARKLLGTLDDLARHRYVSPYGRVLVYLGLNDTAVFKWLERSCDERAGWLMYLATDPRFDALREDARFRSLLERLHLPKIENPAGVSR
ncbi:MAG TPA: tetratricopeptide repeat protein [Candidatus Sulfotelmatobacter sp.]|nr:tetratricopeptide repeat protein [Candidatus Sulfotelmatobacter sp.]